VSVLFDKYFARFLKRGAAAREIFRRKILFEALEQRVLLSADLAPSHDNVFAAADSPATALTDEQLQPSPGVLAAVLASHRTAAALSQSGPDTGFVELDAFNPSTFTATAENTIVVGPADVLRGNVTIDGDVFLSGALSPGNSPGLVTIDGDLTIADGDGRLLIEIGGRAPGPGAGSVNDGYDRVTVTGDVLLADDPGRAAAALRAALDACA